MTAPASSCATCHHSIGQALPPLYEFVLWCSLHSIEPTQPCRDHCREVGSDDE
jgi:hypothetical protein